MEYKKMREYTHEEFVELLSKLSKEEIIDLSAKYGGFPVLLRMALDPRLCHIPIIQPGSAIIIRNEAGQILLQERTDRDKWGLPGGCQDLAEDLKSTALREAKEETGLEINPDDLELIDILSGEERENSYPNGDIVFNNTVLYAVTVSIDDVSTLKGDSETKRLRFFNPEEVPENLMDADLIKAYIKSLNEKHR